MGIPLVVLSLLLFGSPGKPDFSGSWTLDKDRSFSNPAGLDQTMTVTQQGDLVRIEAKLVTAQGQQAVKEEWMLDGVERDFAPPSPANARGKRKAYWLPMDRGIVVEDRVTVETPNGPVLQQTTRKWSLSADGAMLTVDYYIDRPTGSGESRRVFRKLTSSRPGAL
jgi:hypothetical protein